MSKDANTKLIGAFVVGALALIVIVFVIFGSGKFFQKTTDFLIYFHGDVIGLRVGAPVKVRGVDIGSVTKIMPIYDEQGDVLIEVIVKISNNQIKDTIGYYKDMEEKEFMDYLIDKGLRARLETQSLVTGVRYVKLDFFPDSPLNLVGLNKDYYEIPSIMTTGEELTTLLEKGLQTLDEIPLVEIANQLHDTLETANSTLEGIDGLVNSPEVKETLATLSQGVNTLDHFITELDEQLDPIIENRLDALLSSLTETSEAMEESARRSELFMARVESIAIDDQYEIRAALQEIAKASRALRQLVDHLQREPRSLIYGKK
ncbi:MAG: MlaD family protein [Candidatus Aminicenantes bacterium]|jgi:paraquat-inducible protein B